MGRIRTVIAAAAITTTGLATAWPAAARGIDEPAAAARTNIVATARASADFDTLTSLLKRAKLAGTLEGKGPFTVFAPTDRAFAKVPKAALKSLAGDRAKLRAVLLHHVAAGRLTAAKVVKRSSIGTLNGDRVRVRVRHGNVFIGGARVVKPDVRASNGVIHAINRVLIPR